MNLVQVFKRECVRIYGSCNTCYPCPDMFVGLVDKDKNLFCPLLTSYKNLKDWELPTIAIVLESPHIREYDFNGCPIGPAQGRTGTCLKQYIIKILESQNIRGQYKLLLIEAVSFQCSNGGEKINHTSRNQLFKIVWKCGGKRDFLSRIKLYKPQILINACTGGKKGISKSGSLNYLVQQSLEKLTAENSSCQLFYSNHPSDWNDSTRIYNA